MRHLVRWGVLGTAKIATTKVIPAMQKGRASDVIAIASRDHAKAAQAAAALGIEKAYGSYDDLLADPDIDAVYIPLPNHLHVPWAIRAAEAGKHVLCEKPIALSAAEAETLVAARDRTGVLIQEAFMVRTHPQWVAVKQIVASGRLGLVRSMSGWFSYFNDDPENVRNVLAWGGGALMDIGCYLIHTSRFIFGEEPVRVSSAIERDPRFGIDRVTSMLLEYPSGHFTGTCATQAAPYQRMQIVGTLGRIEIEIPFNAPPDEPCQIVIDSVPDLDGGRAEIEFDVCDQYTIQGDLFSRAILDGRPAPCPLEDAVANMRVIDRVRDAATPSRP